MTRFAPDEVLLWCADKCILPITKNDDVIFRDEMSSVGLQANLFVCNAMINGYCNVGRIGEAEKVVSDMEVGYLKPDSYSYNTLLDGYCKEGLMSKAFAICNRMVE